MTTATATVPPRLVSMLKRLVAGPVNVDTTTTAEDRDLAKLEELGLATIGSYRAAITEQGKGLVRGEPAPAAAPATAGKSKRAPYARVSTPDAIVWEEPPVSRWKSARVAVWAGVVEKLKAKPGQWGRILIEPTPELAASRGSSARGWKKKHQVAVEFIARTLSDGRGAVYGRWTGKK
jgi:hypothetical protein